jgi:hypothetical protein|tara:strand:- start:329 stop:568 length:240 start_codon:yes stop_codon:yes gene_type:complete
MINPLIDNLDNLTTQEVEEKITDLQKKYFQTRNPSLQMQVAHLLDIYKIELQDRRVKELNRQRSQEEGENSLDNLINIS